MENPSVLKLQAHGKINLTLQVLGRRADGYHELRSWVALIALADVLEVKITQGDVRLRIQGAPDLPIQNNLVLRAVEAFQKRFGQPQGVELTLHKRIPIAAGLGGGSSDAAATLRALAQLCEVGSEEALTALASELGSDVPLFLHASHGSLWMEGRGERVSAAAPLPPLWALLVKPSFGISAAEAYQAFDARLQSTALPSQPPVRNPHWQGANIGRALSNDLQAGCIERFPELQRLLSALESLSALGVVMSGSGPTCFALFDSLGAARRAAEAFPRGAGDRLWVTGLWSPACESSVAASNRVASARAIQ